MQALGGGSPELPALGEARHGGSLALSRLAAALVLAVGALGAAHAASTDEIPAAAKAHEARLLSKASPAVKAWVRDEARRVRGAGDVNGASVPGSVRARFAGQPGIGSMSNADVDAIAFLVMMQAAKDNEADTKAMLEEMKAANAAKARVRATAQAEKGKLESVRESADGAASATEQLRLQQAMDRRSKMLQTLSNLMKKQSDTQSSIISNLK